MITRLLKFWTDSILAGIMIAIGTIAYLNCPNRIVGAFLFSVGLITIMAFGLRLYTGFVGYVRSWADGLVAMICLLANGVGCSYIALIPTNGAQEIWNTKTEGSLVTAFLKGIICGIIIYLCVAQHKSFGAPTSTIITLIAIPAFILCGAEHSVADICFMFAAKNITVRGLIFIAVVAAGNAIGSLALSLWSEVKDKLR